MTMRTLVRFEYDIENVKLFDIVDGGAVHGAFNGNLTIYFDMSEDGKLLDESKQALRLEARRICRALKNRGMNATVSILNADTKAVYGRVFAEHPEIFTLLLWNHGRGNDLSKEQHALTPSGVYKALERTLIVGNCNKQRWCLTVSTPVFQIGGAGSNPVRCSTSSARTKYTSERSAHR